VTKYHPLIRFNTEPKSKPDFTAEINRVAKLKEERKEHMAKAKSIGKEIKSLEKKISTFVSPKKTKK
jgi:uncharacterized coiled-coil DUF342 family protein